MANINIPDSALFQAGAGPDLKLTHDSNNSIISNATGTLTINNIADANMILGTDDTTAVTIDNSQNVTIAGNLTSTGIDDNASQTALSITSEGRVQHTSSIANSCFDIANTHASGYGAHIQAGSGSLYSLMVKDKDNSPRFTVLGDGKVGIGTASPSNILNVSGTNGNAKIALTDSTNSKTITFETDDGNLHIDTHEGVSKFIFTQNAKLGIGDTAPDALLSIKGTSDGGANPSIRLKYETDSREAWISNYAGDLILANGGDDNTPHCKIQMYDGNIMAFSTANTERMRIDSGGIVKIQESSVDGLSRLDLISVISRTDGQTVNIGIGNGGLVMVSETNSGKSGLFYCTYYSSTIVELADPDNYFEVTDTGSNWAIYKSSNNATVSIKNKTGATKSVSVQTINSHQS